MRSRPSLFQVAYVAIVLATALAVFLPSTPNTAGYVVLLVLALPMSIVAMPILFVVVGFTFSDNGSLLLRLVIVLVWTGIAGLQVVVLREIRQARGNHRSLSG
jgi:predicted neutral ceramidase superfamily lipid hydrolase